MSRSGVEQPTTSSVTKLVASKELVRTKTAVDMIDIAQGLTRSSRIRAELQNLIDPRKHSRAQHTHPWDLHYWAGLGAALWQEPTQAPMHPRRVL